MSVQISSRLLTEAWKSRRKCSPQKNLHICEVAYLAAQEREGDEGRGCLVASLVKVCL